MFNNSFSKLGSVFCGVLVCANQLGAAVPENRFAAPVAVSCAGAQANAQLSRSATSNIVFDTSGNLHLVWWAGPEATNPSNPSGVYHAAWTKETGWGNQLQLAGAPDTFAGRHPTVARDGEGVFAVWHDHRHCSASSSYIDNVELYGAKVKSNGELAQGGIRVTETTADHKGDNGYCPKPVSGDEGRLMTVWYDFNANYNISDIYLSALKPADSSDLSVPVDMGASRLTNASTHPGNAYTVCDAAFGAQADKVAMAWVAGTGWIQDLVYTEVFPDSGNTSISPITLASSDVSFFDPPCVRISPTTGDTVVLWPSQEFEESQLKMRIKPEGGAFSSAVDIDSQPGRTQRYITGAFDRQGYLHLVWNDNRNGKADIWYRVCDLSNGDKSDTICLTQGTTTAWGRCSLALSDLGIPYVVAERSGGSLWLISTAAPAMVKDWALYYQ